MVSVMPQSKIQTRLCPHCANSVGLNALTCPYCKGDLLRSAEPQWPEYETDHDGPSVLPEKEKLPLPSKVILVLGLLVFALGVYLVGGNVERQDLRPVMDEQQKALLERDEKIKNLESQLAELRQSTQGTTQQIEQLKVKLARNEKELAAAQRKVATVTQEMARVSSNRASSSPKPAVRTSDPQPAPAATTRGSSATQPRTYETVRSTPVYEEPANSSRVLAQIAKGTEITVVSSNNGWLEIRSRHGKPPGFIRADDAMFVSRAAK